MLSNLTRKVYKQMFCLKQNILQADKQEFVILHLHENLTLMFKIFREIVNSMCIKGKTLSNVTQKIYIRLSLTKSLC